MKTEYRADIDGLRAIAVLSVLLFHGGFSAFGGGYVGVDVFFVISGYLITGIVLREVENREFSVVRFYERRVRRIFPALFVTITATLGLGALLFIPSAFKALAESAVAVTLFVSNILFWQESGYFGGAAEQKPLLHTWSLAVEEQFYIAFPLVLVCIRRFFGARYALCLGMIAVVSLGANLYGTYTSPLATFYLAPARAWELLLGAIIGCDALKPLASIKLRNALAMLGLIFIGLSVFLFDAQTPFPGAAAFLPTVGAALLIYTGAGGKTIVSKMLSVKPLVFVGLISYSLYLVHWPLIVFAKHLAIVKLAAYQMAAVLLLSLGLGVVSWHFVEKPFRSKQVVNRRKLFALASAVMAGAFAVGQFIVAKDGFPQRFNGVLLGESREFSSCEAKSQALCQIGNPGSKPTFMFWGDSHALALAPGVSRSASMHTANGYFATKGGCPPLLGIERRYNHCIDFNNEIASYIESHPELQTVILASRWTWYARGSYKSETAPMPILTDAWGDSGPDVDNDKLVDIGLTRTVNKLLLMGRHVILVRAIPDVGYHVVDAYAIANLTGRDVEELIAPTRKEYNVRNEGTLRLIDSQLKLKGVREIDLLPAFCGELRCRVLDNGHPLYKDANHLSTYGALLVSSSFDELFKRNGTE